MSCVFTGKDSSECRALFLTDWEWKIYRELPIVAQKATVLVELGGLEGKVKGCSESRSESKRVS